MRRILLASLILGLVFVSGCKINENEIDLLFSYNPNTKMNCASIPYSDSYIIECSRNLDNVSCEYFNNSLKNGELCFKELPENKITLIYSNLIFENKIIRLADYSENAFAYSVNNTEEFLKFVEEKGVMESTHIGCDMDYMFDIIKVKHDEIEFNKDNKYKGE